MSTFIATNSFDLDHCLAISEENKNELDTYNNKNANAALSIDKTMRDLERIGRLLNLADVGSQGFFVNVQVQVHFHHEGVLSVLLTNIIWTI